MELNLLVLENTLRKSGKIKKFNKYIEIFFNLMRIQRKKIEKNGLKFTEDD